MAVTFKRKRGRPRLDEPREINDFDMALIQEFKRRTAFYDRQHPDHRNRDYIDRQWQQIAQNLNSTVNMVKSRMLQLRNRYNLEKRRVEALQEQHQDENITSQWILYKSLSFLGEHIRPRRQYSLPIIQPKNSPITTFSDVEEGIMEGASNGHGKEHHNMSSPHIGASHKRFQFHQNQRSNGVVQNRLDIANDIELMAGNNKFKAFGQFLASSLIDMSEVHALRLVDKFTSELVKSIIADKQAKCLRTSSNSVTNAEESDTNLDLSI